MVLPIFARSHTALLCNDAIYRWRVNKLNNFILNRKVHHVSQMKFMMMFLIGYEEKKG